MSDIYFILHLLRKSYLLTYFAILRSLCSWQYRGIVVYIIHIIQQLADLITLSNTQFVLYCCYLSLNILYKIDNFIQNVYKLSETWILCILLLFYLIIIDLIDINMCKTSYRLCKCNKTFCRCTENAWAKIE